MRSYLIVALFCMAVPVWAQQGIKGQVAWLEGNLMPGPDGDKPEGKGISRTILIYPELTFAHVTLQGVFFAVKHAKPVRQIKSNNKGKFCVKLPPGTYSVLVREAEGLYANRFDAAGRINPVEVKKGAYTEITIVVDYKAAY